MATIARSQAAGFTDYGAEAEDIARRRKMAEMMQMQALEPIKQETAGGYVVPISWTQGLAKALQAGVGGYQQGQLKDEARQLAARRGQAISEAIRGMPQDRTETAPGPDDGSGIPSPNVTTTIPATWQEKAGWLGTLANVDPVAANIGSTLLGMQQRGEENQLNRDARIEERKMRIDSERRQLEMRLTDRAISEAERNALMERMKQLEIASREAEGERNRQSRETLVQLAGSFRQPPALQIIQSGDQPMQVGRDGVARPIVDAQGNPVASKSTPAKAMPASAAKGLLENQQSFRAASQALALLEGQQLGDMVGDKEATGWKGFIPDFALQRLDPAGVATRAAISDIGSLKIHDRSGAAVSAKEFPRLKPFVPSATDDPETARKKVARFVKEYKDIMDEMIDFYRASGFNVPAETLRGPNGPTAPSNKVIRFDAQGNQIP